MELAAQFQLSARAEALCLLLGEMLYTYYFVLRWKRPGSRLLALLLVLPPTLLVPWRGPSGVERILFAFVFVWVIGTKLLLVAWGRGPAKDPLALSSFARFFSAMVFTLHLKFDDHRPPLVAASGFGGYPEASRNGDSSGDSPAAKVDANLVDRNASENGDLSGFHHSGMDLKGSSDGDSGPNGVGRRKNAARSGREYSSNGDSRAAELDADESNPNALGNDHFSEGAAGNTRESDLRASSYVDSAPNGVIQRKSASRSESDGDVRRRVPESQAGVDLGEKTDVRDEKGRSYASAGANFVSALVNSQMGYIVVLRSLFYFLVCASLVRVLLAWKPQIPESFLALIYGFLIYFSCLFMFEGAAGIPAMVAMIQLHPQFDMPYLATSLGDFWGRRWNLLVNNLLRASVYGPILEWEMRQRVKKGEKSSKSSGEARAAGLFASFLVSGLMHELIFFYALKRSPSWEMTEFFVMNGLGTIVETLVMRSRISKGGFSLPVFVRWAYTIGFVYATARWLFFPPLDRLGLIDSSLVDLGRFIDWVEQAVGLS